MALHSRIQRLESVFGYKLALFQVGSKQIRSKSSAIMMIDFALDNERNKGETPEESIYQGALVRFRPIMMTTFAALMGTLPITIGFGAGAGSRRSLGLAVVGGLIFSQIITLYITPVYYVYLDRLQNKFGRGRKKDRTAGQRIAEGTLVGDRGRVA
ncbi:MAG: efflux RND transporter permease subunit [Terriglobales bacterium]